jgi:hypothetical protein
METHVVIREIEETHSGFNLKNVFLVPIADFPTEAQINELLANEVPNDKDFVCSVIAFIKTLSGE